ncbi:uncharacterized protein LOC135346040 [Halichondria panicea]|uniref:uncharacterized protein LOC135346040 n=1 Tax=Halichondria panicea TaxID=6063 RepID=UPI00312B91EA
MVEHYCTVNNSYMLPIAFQDSVTTNLHELFSEHFFIFALTHFIIQPTKPIYNTIMTYSVAIFTAVISATILISCADVLHAQQVQSPTCQTGYTTMIVNNKCKCVKVSPLWPKCSTNFDLVTINGECKCRCKTTNWCPSGQKWDSNICACVNDNDNDVCTLSCRLPKVRHSTQCRCVCPNSCPGTDQNLRTCECLSLCDFEGNCFLNSS